MTQVVFDGVGVPERLVTTPTIIEYLDVLERALMNRLHARVPLLGPEGKQ